MSLQGRISPGHTESRRNHFTPVFGYTFCVFSLLLTPCGEAAAPKFSVLLPGRVFICRTMNSLLESSHSPQINVHFKVLHPDQDKFLSLDMENGGKLRLEWGQDAEWGSEAACSAQAGAGTGAVPCWMTPVGNRSFSSFVQSPMAKDSGTQKWGLE